MKKSLTGKGTFIFDQLKKSFLKRLLYRSVDMFDNSYDLSKTIRLYVEITYLD